MSSVPLVTNDSLGTMSAGSAAYGAVAKEEYKQEHKQPLGIAGAGQSTMQSAAEQFVAGLIHPREIVLMNLSSQVTTVTLQLPEGTYAGEVNKEGKPHGKGTLTYLSTDQYKRNTYVGQFVDGNRHGSGVLTWNDRRRYEGEFDKGWIHGRGRTTHPNGDVYDGDYVRDQRSGRGVLSHIDGRRYEGLFANDLKNGQGMMTYPDKRVYSGNWVDDCQHGYGEMTEGDGSKYSGNWERGQASGQGVLCRKVGFREVTFTGTFRNGSLWNGVDSDQFIYKNGANQGRSCGCTIL
jgi:hypothetical protein